MKVSFELNLDHNNMMVWSDVLQAMGSMITKYPKLMEEVSDAFNEAMDEALGEINIEDVPDDAQ